MVFCEFLKKKTNQPQNLGFETLISFVTIMNLTPGIIIFDVLLPILPHVWIGWVPPPPFTDFFLAEKVYGFGGTPRPPLWPESVKRFLKTSLREGLQ